MSTDHWNLIAKYLSGNASRDEEEKLKQWAKSAHENQKELETLEKLWKHSGQAHSNFQPKTEDEWNRLRKKLEAPAKEPIPDSGLANIRKLAAVFLLLITAGVLLYYLFDKQTNKFPQLTVVTTPKDSIATIFLPDSSHVRINENSRLSYTSKSFASHRNIQLSGEAFFEVRYDKNAPFAVHAGHTVTEVSGTSFNVKAYEKEEEVEVTVISGKVGFYPKDEPEGKLDIEAGYKGKYNKQNRSIKEEKSNDNFGWWIKKTEKKVKNLIRKIGKKIN